MNDNATEKILVVGDSHTGAIPPELKELIAAGAPVDIKDYPDIVTDQKKLRVKSRATTEAECEELGLWDKMKHILDTHENAAAVTAIQIGYPIRACMCRFITVDGKTEDVRFVNPRITKNFGFISAREGCLSIPGQQVRTGRAKHIGVEDVVHGEQAFHDICAIIVQHEIDHMDGVLMMDRAATGTIRREEPKTGRNDPCPCGSGKKYKRCCDR